MTTYFLLGSYTFLFFLFVVFGFTVSSDDGFLSSTQLFTFSNNRTIVSRSGRFELGLFNPSSTSHWYLGVWFRNISKDPYVWVANRDSPLTSPVGILRVLKSKVVLFDQSNEQKWSEKINEENEASPIVAKLLDNGNFILRHSNHNTFLWQSFHYPTDVLLPDMELVWEVEYYTSKFLTSWQNTTDPAHGNFTFGIEDPHHSFPAIFTWSYDMKLSRINPLLTTTFTVRVPQHHPETVIQFSLIVSENGDARYSYRMDDKYKAMMRLSTSGYLQYLTWDETNSSWLIWWSSIEDACDIYKFCGRNSYCKVREVCTCLSGFMPKNPEAWALQNWSDGCIRKDISICLLSNNYQLLKNVKLPETTHAVMKWNIGVDECKQKCATDCNCSAFTTVMRTGTSGCVIWTGELLDFRQYKTFGYDLYVKQEVNEKNPVEKEIKKKPNTKLIIGVSVYALGCIITALIFLYWRRSKKLEQGHLSGEDIVDNVELPLMSFQSIVDATDNFSVSNKLGKGGFGTVYKGRLHDNQVIAVKRLSVLSVQGIEEFKNELMLITKLQHVNLVRLCGYCINGNEKLLIYEYLENKSLDLHLFNANQNGKLLWPSRLHIAVGIARGLSYLHEDSALRIIHRDLKPSNVLLDKDMNPKISDFGMARIFGRGNNEVETTVVAGTLGYMAPEYTTQGTYSVKSDVFSFGVIILEILSGKMNREFHRENKDHTSLLTYAWKKWTKGEWDCVLDHVIVSSSEEVKRCFQIGLLCVQDRPEDRPVMSSVLVMLLSKTEMIPLPKPPAYYVDQAGASSSNTQGLSNVKYDDSFLTIVPR